MDVHHIGYIVSSIPSSIDAFTSLGYSIVHETIFDEVRNVYLALVRLNTITVELVQPNDKSSLWNLQKKFGNAPYHICYLCTSLNEQISLLRMRGFFPVQTPAPAILFNGKMVCFMFHKEMGLVELLEATPNDFLYSTKFD